MSKGHLTESKINLMQAYINNDDTNPSEAALGQLAVSQAHIESLRNTPFREPQQVLVTHYRPNGGRLPPETNLPPKIIPQSFRK